MVAFFRVKPFLPPPTEKSLEEREASAALAPHKALFRGRSCCNARKFRFFQKCMGVESPAFGFTAAHRKLFVSNNFHQKGLREQLDQRLRSPDFQGWEGGAAARVTSSSCTSEVQALFLCWSFAKTLTEAGSGAELYPCTMGTDHFPTHDCYSQEPDNPVKALQKSWQKVCNSNKYKKIQQHLGQDIPLSCPLNKAILSLLLCPLSGARCTEGSREPFPCSLPSWPVPAA